MHGDLLLCKIRAVKASANKRKSVFRLPAGLLVLCALLAACEPARPWRGLDVSGVFPNLEFSLTGSNGQAVSASDFAGKPVLLYFGFTNCPGICPATLAHISAALDQLGDDARHIRVILASVDPARDTPEAIKDYTSRFGPWLHGVTGDEQALRDLNRAYKVDFAVQPETADGGYDVMHSNRVFAFDSKGRCRVLLPEASDTDAFVSDLRKLLAEEGMI